MCDHARSYCSLGLSKQVVLRKSTSAILNERTIFLLIFLILCFLSAYRVPVFSAEEVVDTLTIMTFIVIAHIVKIQGR